jgi:hypothetical protein
MRPAVRVAFVAFSARFEGVVGWMYQDVKGLVSTGIGNLIDPVDLAMHLPFVRVGDGRSATPQEIAAEWHRIKTLPPDASGRTAAQLGHLYAKGFTTLRLMSDGITAVVLAKLASNETILKGAFQDWEDWPADAQLATLSMSWAVGPAFWSPHAGRNYWPRLTAALKDRDFRTASVECFMNEERRNPGIAPRNIANRVLYTNAAIAMSELDPAQLYYPTDLEASPSSRTVDTIPPEGEPSRRPPVIEDFQKVYSPPPLRGDDDDLDEDDG